MNYTLHNLNGLEVILAPMQESNTTTVEIFVKAWSVYETKKSNGLSHFLEHMFFKGGIKYPTPMSVAASVDAFGGEFNAYTSDEYAGYYVKSAPQHTYKALDILSDMIVDSQFPEAELEREKGVITQEIMMDNDNPWRNVRRRWAQRYKGDNSFWRSTLWPVENVQWFTRQDFFDHKEMLYTKDNLVIVIAGKIEDSKEILEKIWELFDELPTKNQAPKISYLAHEPASHSSFFDKGTEQNHVIISAPGYTMDDDRRYAAGIMTNILWSGMASRLFQRIREQRGLCYSIWATHDANIYSWDFLIKAGLDKTRRDGWIQAIYDELALISSGDITQAEYDRAQWNITWSIQMGIETSDSLARFIGMQYLLTWSIQTLDDKLAKYAAVTLADVNNIASGLHKDKLWTYWIQ